MVSRSSLVSVQRVGPISSNLSSGSPSGQNGLNDGPNRPALAEIAKLGYVGNFWTTHGQLWGDFGAGRGRRGRLSGTHGQQLSGKFRPRVASLPESDALGPPASQDPCFFGAPPAT